MTRVDPPYFPPLTFGDDAERDAFMQQWFGKHLHSMDEPRLYLAYPLDVIRLLTLPTFHEPRLESKGFGMELGQIQQLSGTSFVGTPEADHRLDRTEPQKLSR